MLASIRPVLSRLGNRTGPRNLVAVLLFFLTGAILNAQVIAQVTEEQQKVFNLAEKYVENYKQTLSDYIIQQKTCHYLDKNGDGAKWKKTGCLEEEVSFFGDWGETSKYIKGKRSNAPHCPKLLDYLVVHVCVFERDSRIKTQPEIAWEREEMIDGRRVFAFSYRIPQSRSPVYLLGDGPDSEHVGFHGLAFVDCATGAIMRIENEVEPSSASSHHKGRKAIIKFSLVPIAGSEYMLPVDVSSYSFVDKSVFKNDTIVTKYRKFVVDTKIGYEIQPEKLLRK
jgi:hypothetical protein